MAEPRLPTVGGDDNNWGTLLNQFLEVSHNSNGTLKDLGQPNGIAQLDSSGKVAATNLPIDPDDTLAANSDSKVPSQKAAKTYVDTKDAQNVKLTGTQSIAGDKTFTGMTSVDNGLGAAKFTAYLGGFLQLFKTSGDAQPSVQLYSGDRSVQFGAGGSTALDTSIKRTGANQLDFGSAKLQSVADPVNAQDVATKNYVDNNGGGDGTKQALLQAVIPKMWRKVYRVNPSALSGAQASTSVYTTITAAIAAAKSDFNGFGSGYDSGPEYRRLIMIDPGTYNEQITNVPTFVDIVGSSGVAADVVINYSGTSGPTMELAGGTHYIANLTLIQSGTNAAGGVYPLHTDSPPSYPGSNVNAPQVKVFTNIVFTSTNPNRGEAAGIGMPGRAAYLFVDCIFNPYTANSGVNVHNTASQKWPAQITFLDCEIHTSGNVAIHFSDLGSGQPDRAAWIGGTLDVSAGANQVAWITQTAGHTFQLDLDPSVVTTAVLGNSSYPTTVSYVKVPAGPDLLGTLSSDIQSYYYPSAINQVLTLYTPCDPDAYNTLTANRMYFVPIPINVAVNVQKMNIICQTAAGSVAAGIYADNGAGKPSGYISTKAPGSLSSGINTLTGNYLRTVYPGTRQIWLGIVVTDGTATLATSAFLSSYQQCYYQDLSAGFSSVPVTAAPVALSAGTIVPVGTVLTQ